MYSRVEQISKKIHNGRNGNFSSIQNEQADKRITKALSLTFHELEKADLTPEMFVQLFLQAHETYLPLGTQHDSDEFMQDLINIMTRASPDLSKIVKALFEIEFIETTKNV